MKNKIITALLTFSFLLFGKNAFTQDYVDTTKTAKPIVKAIIVSENDGRGEVLLNTDYLISTNGYNLSKGELRYSNTYLFYNNISLGLSNNFSMNLGIVPLGFSGFYNIGGKYTFNSSETIRLAINGNYISSGNSFSSSNYGIGTLSFTSTFGKSNSNLSLGATFLIGSGGVAFNIPIINISGITRIGERVALTTDNYIVIASSEVGGGSSFGFRFLFPGVLADVGLLTSRSFYSKFPSLFPYAKLSIRLTRGK